MLVIFKDSLPTKSVLRTLSVLPLEDKKGDQGIPYLFDKPSASNEIKSELKDVPKLDVTAGTKFLLVSTFSKNTLIPGRIYVLDGLFQDAYQEKGKDLMLSLRCASITESDMSFEECHDRLQNIRFDRRSLDPERDFFQKNGGFTHHVDKNRDTGYRFLHIGLNPEEGDKTGTLYAVKVPLSRDMSYSDRVSFFDKETQAYKDPISAITGGLLNGRTTLTALYRVQQNNEERPFVFEMDTMITHGLENTQLEWTTYSRAVEPHLRGYFVCQINPKKTAERSVNAPAPGVYCSTILHPDMKAVCLSMGVKLDWCMATTLDPRLLNLATLTAMYTPEVCYKFQTAINLSNFSGNAERVKEYVEKEWVELRAIVSEPMGDVAAIAELNAKSGDARLEAIKQSGGEVSIFIMPTTECPPGCFHSCYEQVNPSKRMKPIY